MKTPEEWHHTKPYIEAQRRSNPNWECWCVSCEHIRAIQADARAGMVPVEKVKPLAQAIDYYSHGKDPNALKQLEILNGLMLKAGQTAKELGL